MALVSMDCMRGLAILSEKIRKGEAKMAAKKKVVEEDDIKIRKLKAPKVKEDKRSKFEKIVDLAKQCSDALGIEGKVYVGRDHEIFERLPTGNLALDAVTGGGLVRRHLMELYGEESGGKTTAALQTSGNVQRLRLKKKTSGIVVWVKGEEFDEEWAERQGVDVNKLVMVEALTGDDALETTATIVEEGDPDLVVIDSYQALGTRKESEDGVDKAAYAGGGAPQLWGRFYRRTRGAFNGRRAKTSIIGISQVRDQIGGFSPNGKPEPTPTRIRTLRHWKSIAVLCRRGEPKYDDPSSEKKRIVSREFHFKCTKNKTSIPDRVSAYLYLFRGEKTGVDVVDAAMRLGMVYEILGVSGSSISGYGLKANGKKRFYKLLEKNEDILEALTDDILDAIAEEG